MVCILVCGAIINNNKILYIYKRCKNQELQVSSFSHITYQHQSSSKCFLRKPFLKATPHNLIFTPVSTNIQLVWEGPSCLKYTYTTIYIYTYDNICMYTYTASISPNPLSFNVHFPVSIVAFQCHTLKLQDRIHLNIAVAGPTSTLAEETNHSVACGPICFPYVVHGNKKLKAAGQPLVLPPWVSASSG